MTTSAYSSSPVAETPTTFPSSTISSSTKIPGIISAPASSAFEANHLSNVERSTV